MASIGFKGHCQRGHERIDFTDGEAFAEHMVKQHGARKVKAGGTAEATLAGKGVAPGWTSGGNIAKPYAWRAPRPTRGSARRAEQVLRESGGSLNTPAWQALRAG